jgi:hypothetical protein
VKQPKTTTKTTSKPAAQQRSASVVVESDEFYGVLPIATIAKRLDLDRSIVKKRLDHHKYTPVSSRQKLKLYEFDAEMEAVLLETDTKLNDARARKENAAADINEMKVQQMKGELVPLGECIDAIGLITGGLYKEIAVRLPDKIAAKLHKCESVADVKAILARELDKQFQEARANHAKWLPADVKEKRAA